MNLWWEVSAVDDTALGGWLANLARLGTIALAILLTIYKDRIWRRLPSETANIDEEPSPPAPLPRAGEGCGLVSLQASQASAS